MRRALSALILPGLLLGGCAADPLSAPDNEPYLSALVGAREDQVISTLGVPNRAYQVGALTVLGFDRVRVFGDPNAPRVQTVPADAVLVPACELTFFVRGGYVPPSRRVVSYAYTGPDCR